MGVLVKETSEQAHSVRKAKAMKLKKQFGTEEKTEG